MRFLLFVVLTLPAITGYARRTYATGSVLATGNWYKIATKDPGIYKIDVKFLQSLGVATGHLPSNSIRIFGNGGSMLPEACNGPKIDDLYENAVYVEDGGDGLFDGSDYLLFYAPGPHAWLKDSVNRNFVHQKNLYSEQAFYYLTVGGTAKKINSSPALLSANTTPPSTSIIFMSLIP